jgi:hypothetical protein
MNLTVAFGARSLSAIRSSVYDPLRGDCECRARASFKHLTQIHQAPAVRGWTVCRFHGARGGAPKGKANGAYKHGLHTKEAKEQRRLLSDLLRQSRKAIAVLSCEGKQ